jgi:hypothetical protein
MHMYVYKHGYVCVHNVCVYTYIFCSRGGLKVCICMCISMGMYVYIYIQFFARRAEGMHTYVYKHGYVCVFTYIFYSPGGLKVFTCMCMGIYMYMYTHFFRLEG